VTKNGKENKNDLREKTMKIVLTICATVVICTAANAGMVAINSADIMQVGPDPIAGSPNAGEINITVSGIGGGLDGTLNTFCVETREHLQVGNTYNAQSNTAAIKGGQPVSDPLGPETAWLFWQYISGADPLNNTQAMADFQCAIWAWEGEYAVASLNAAALAYYNSATNKSLGGPDGLGPVRVLNLGSFDENNTWQYQDLLVPEPATLTILGLGVGAMSLLRRKRAV